MGCCSSKQKEDVEEERESPHIAIPKPPAVKVEVEEPVEKVIKEEAPTETKIVQDELKFPEDDDDGLGARSKSYMQATSRPMFDPTAVVLKHVELPTNKHDEDRSESTSPLAQVHLRHVETREGNKIVRLSTFDQEAMDRISPPKEDMSARLATQRLSKGPLFEKEAEEDLPPLEHVDDGEEDADQARILEALAKLEEPKPVKHLEAPKVTLRRVDSSPDTSSKLSPQVSIDDIPRIHVAKQSSAAKIAEEKMYKGPLFPVETRPSRTSSPSKIPAKDFDSTQKKTDEPVSNTATTPSAGDGDEDFEHDDAETSVSPESFRSKILDAISQYDDSQPEHSDNNEILSQLIKSASTKLLSEPFILSESDTVQTTTLLEAISQKKLGAVMALLYAGVPTNTVVNGSTALHHALSQPGMSEEMVSMLLQGGAQVDARNQKQQTPLHTACQTGKVPLVQLLLDFHADVHAVDDENHGCSYFADSNNAALMDVLKAAGLESADEETHTTNLVKVTPKKDVYKIKEETPCKEEISPTSSIASLPRVHVARRSSAVRLAEEKMGKGPLFPVET
eukprot:m.162960 g.162960  ORF g.162960 m.162960 type:complete len:565 (-) comp15209_c0_seq2:7180-8874(-)